MPLPTVVVPTFNDAPYIGATLESLQAQTLADFECIIVDDGSTDPTVEIASALVQRDKRFRYFRLEHSGGPAGPRNFAAERASGSVLVFLDSDDLAAPNLLERVCGAFAANPGAGVVYHDYFVFDDKNPAQRERYFSQRCPTPEGRIPKALYGAGLHITGTASVRTDIYRKFGGQRTDFAIAEDYEFFLRISPHVACTYIDEPLKLVRRHKPSHLSGNVVRSLEARLRILDQFDSANPEVIQEFARERARVRGTMLSHLARAHLWEGHDAAARETMYRALRESPSLQNVAWAMVAMLRLGGVARLARRAIAPFRAKGME